MVLVVIKWFNNKGLFIYFFCNFILKYLHGGGLVGGGGIYKWFFGGFISMFCGWFVNVLCVINCNKLPVALWDVCLLV